MYKLKMESGAIILKESMAYGNYEILRSKKAVDEQIEKIQKEVKNREETLKDLKQLKCELKE